MSGDARYTADDALLWKAYVEKVHAFANQRSGHPGPPPRGYLESYRMRHPMAPVVEDFPAVLASWEQRHNTASTASAHSNGVAMPIEAFGALLNMLDTILQTMGRLMGNPAMRTAGQPAMRAVPYFPKNKSRLLGRVRGKFVGRGGHAGRRGRRQGRFKFGRRGARASGISVGMVNVKAESSAAAVDVKREETPLPVEFGEMDPVQEDIHMDDARRDDDDQDDSAAGAVANSGWDGEEAVEYM
ncbi:hypothetical protein DFH09DRAFT_1338827 [Mycena vulgaris]|nr:hypothetical protein DFH09DRAFT_1338827 [Mycena vulgaris]